MLLLIMCRDLEVTDRRMTTASKLGLAQVFVSSATALVPQLVPKGVLHRRLLPERGPSAAPVPPPHSPGLCGSAGGTLLAHPASRHHTDRTLPH